MATTKTAAKKRTATTTKKAATATNKAPAAASKEKFAYIFFNCDENKSQASKNVSYNNVLYSDTIAGRKALLEKVKSEAEAGRVNIADEAVVEKVILKGDPVEAAAQLQYGDIEKLTAVKRF